MPRPGANTRLRFDRLRIEVTNISGESTASLATVSVWNADAPAGDGNIFSGSIDGLHDLFRRLGFTPSGVEFTQE